jgi:hypothetical protein
MIALMRRAFFLIFLFPFTASAWTRTADFQIADRAARLAPHDLNTLIKRFSKYNAAGADYGIKEEETDSHRCISAIGLARRPAASSA